MRYYTMWLAPVKSFFVPFWELGTRKRLVAFGIDGTDATARGTRQTAQTRRRNAAASLAGGLLRSQISCVEDRGSISMRELKVQIGNSG